MGPIDVTHWRPLGDEQVGTKPKQWLLNPDDPARWLWKAVETATLKGGLDYYRGDDWAECLASLAASSLGIPCAEVALATRGGVPGVISKDFSGQDDLVLGNEVLSASDDGYPSSADRFDEHYTVDLVTNALERFDGPTDGPFLDAPPNFVGYLVLDGWIGNTDRHHQNWGGLIHPISGEARLAPTFDHASSLGFLLHDQARTEYLSSSDSARTVETWADRAKTPFAGRPHPCEVALAALQGTRIEVAQHWLERLAESVRNVDDIISAVPTGSMTEAGAAFAARLLRHNGQRMLSHPLRILEE